MSSNSHYVAERAFRQCLDSLHYKVVYYPVACLMDIGLNACRSAGRIPVVFAILLRGELRSLTSQKQWDGSEIDVLLLCEQQVLLQSVAIGIKVNAFFVKRAP